MTPKLKKLMKEKAKKRSNLYGIDFGAGYENGFTACYQTLEEMGVFEALEKSSDSGHWPGCLTEMRGYKCECHKSWCKPALKALGLGDEK